MLWDREIIIHVPLCVFSRPAQTQYKTSNPTAARAYRGRLKHGVCPFNVPFCRPDTDPDCVCRNTKKRREEWLQHPVDLPSVGAAERWRAFNVCAAAAAPALMQPRTKRPPVMFQPRLFSPVKRLRHFKIKVPVSGYVQGRPCTQNECMYAAQHLGTRAVHERWRIDTLELASTIKLIINPPKL